MNLAFAALLTAGAVYFLLHRQTFDLFAVAFGGCAFYFLPLLVGYVPDWNGPDPLANHIPLSGGTYAVGVGFAVAVLCAAFLFDLKSPRSAIRVPLAQSSLANWYLLLAFIGLIGASRSGKILELNKTLLLTQVGYWFVLFETAAAMAWIDAFFFRRHIRLSIATALLIIDLVLGFRMTTIMVFIACVTLNLGSYGPIRLWRKLLVLAVVIAGMFVFMLSINFFRGVLLPRLGMQYTELDASPIAPASGTIASPQQQLQAAQPKQIDIKRREITELLPYLLERMEPFITQAILSETTRQNFTCAPTRMANVALIIPFAGKFLGPPTTFESEFKPALFPNYWAGMAGNIWAEAFCGFGYAGVAAEIILVVSALAGMQFFLFRSRSFAIPPMILSGVLLAFYVHRNDRLFEMLLIRRVAIVFAMAWLLKVLYAAYRSRNARRATTGLPKPTG